MLENVKPEYLNFILSMFPKMPEIATNAEKQPSIYSAIANVKKGIDPIGKNKDVNIKNGPKFKFRGIDDVQIAISPLFEDNNITVEPYLISKSSTLVTTKKQGKNGFYEAVSRHHEAVYLYKLTCNYDGSYVTGMGVGEANENSDKGAGKCSSYAYKDFLYKFFCIPTEDQRDPDENCEQIGKAVSNNNRPATNQQNRQTNAVANAPQLAPKENIKQLIDYCNTHGPQFGFNISWCESGVGKKVGQFTMQDLKIIENELKKNGWLQ